MTNRERFEAFLWRTYDRLNAAYFGGACQVQNIRCARFSGDFKSADRVTLGMYDMEERTIFINYYFARMYERNLLKREAELVLHHEMAHAMLANAVQPVRFGQYQPCGGAHGPDFERLMNLHPDSKFDMNPLFATAFAWTRNEAAISRRK